MKISILLPYFNRKKLLETTLNQFLNLYIIYNIEIIIVDDCSNDKNKLDDLIYNYPFKIKLIRLKNKNWINPVIAINTAINNVSIDSDILIFQSPEIFHCNDIIGFILKNLKNDQYFCFNVFMSPCLKTNKVLRKLFKSNCSDYKKFFINKIKLNKYKLLYDDSVINNWKGWYQHNEHNNRKYHFLSAVKTKQFKKHIGGFCNKMANGLWYDDDDFLHRIKKKFKIKSINENLFAIHQWHPSSSHDKHSISVKNLIERNKKIYNFNVNEKKIFINSKIKKKNIIDFIKTN
jgi:glycosyltransferase involved in cell wall biosynthesis